MTAPRGIPLRADPGELARMETRSLHRALASQALAILRSTEAGQILKASWPRDERARQILKGAVTPLATTDAPSLVHTITETYRSLAPGSAAIELFSHPRSLRLDLSGIGQVQIPNLSVLPPAPIFIQEGFPAPAVQWNFIKTQLGPTRKILITAGVTAEIQDASGDTAADVIGRVLADRCNKSIDKAVFGTQGPDDGVTPAGLLYGVNPIAGSTATEVFQSMADDLANLADAIGSAGIDTSDLVYVAGPREATIIKTLASDAFDNEVLTTLGLPPKSVCAFAPAAVYSGYREVPVIETSKDATLVQNDVAAELVSAAGTPGAPAISYFQAAGIAIKVRARLAFAVAAGGAAVVNNVNW